MKLLLVTLLTVTVVVGANFEWGDQDDKRVLDAVNTVNDLLDVTGDAVPFVPNPTDSPVQQLFIGKLLGGIFQAGMGLMGAYQTKKLEKAIKELGKQIEEGFAQMNERLDKLEQMISKSFQELKAFIARKQFETDVTDPATVLWGQAMAFMDEKTCNSLSFGNLIESCLHQTPWKIALKIHNRLYGPDNLLLTQIQTDGYSNSSFTKTKDMLMYRMFQMMTVQSVCLGMQYGPEYNVTEDWEMKRLGVLYDEITQNIIDMRGSQERDYFSREIYNLALGEIISETEANTVVANRIRDKLHSLYPWDSFFVDVSDRTCDQFRSFFFTNVGGVHSFYGADEKFKKAVRISRFWPRDLKCEEIDNYKRAITEKAATIECDLLGTAQHLGLADNSSISVSTVAFDSCHTSMDDSAFAFMPGVVFVNANETQCKRNNLHVYEIFGEDKRPGSIAYDLGFWLRDPAVKGQPAPTPRVKAAGCTPTTPQ